MDEKSFEGKWKHIRAEALKLNSEFRRLVLEINREKRVFSSDVGMTGNLPLKKQRKVSQAMQSLSDYLSEVRGKVRGAVCSKVLMFLPITNFPLMLRLCELRRLRLTGLVSDYLSLNP